MTERAQQFWEQFRQWPRAFQWLTIATVGTLAFIVWDDTVQAKSKAYATAANEIASRAERVRGLDALERQLKSLEEPIASIGRVEVPGNAARGHDDLNAVVNELLSNYRVSNDEFKSRPEGFLPKKALPLITKNGEKRIQVLKGDLTFESTPEDAIAIIGALESDPAVETIRMLRMNKISAGKVRVRVVVESWVLGKNRSGRNRA